MSGRRKNWRYEVEQLFEQSDRAAALVERAMTRISQEGTLEPGTEPAWRRVWEDVVEQLAAVPEQPASSEEHDHSTTDPASPEEGGSTG